MTHTSTALEQVCAFTRLPVDGRWIAASAQLVKSSASHAKHSVQNYTALSDRVQFGSDKVRILVNLVRSVISTIVACSRSDPVEPISVCQHMPRHWRIKTESLTFSRSHRPSAVIIARNCSACRKKPRRKNVIKQKLHQRAPVGERAGSWCLIRVSRLRSLWLPRSRRARRSARVQETVDARCSSREAPTDSRAEARSLPKALMARANVVYSTP